MVDICMDGWADGWMDRFEGVGVAEMGGWRMGWVLGGIWSGCWVLGGGICVAGLVVNRGGCEIGR